MKVALITIATGKKYREYAGAMFYSAQEFFPEAYRVAFTDGIGAEDPESDIVFPFVAHAHTCFLVPSAGYPEATLKRYHTFLTREGFLSSFDQIFYADADMKFVAPVGDIYSEGLTATLHPGYINTRGTPETNPLSRAWCIDNTAYYCGGFQGGDARAYLNAMRIMRDNIDADAAKGITAVWHDESHWNKYLTAYYKPAKVLGPEYCYPDVSNDYYRDKWRAAGLGEVKPILLALTKDFR